MYFDIGANIGDWALSNINNCERILAVEASPSTYIKLQENCHNNKIELLNYAVCNNNGEDITFYNSNSDTLSTLNKEWLTDKKSRFYNHDTYEEIICKTITIDKLIEQYGKPNLIKIDVEGGEYECVSSLTQKVDNLCFEWASEMNDVTFKCLDHLHKLGFDEFYIQLRDAYTFRPTEYYDINTAKINLMNTTPKDHWGMLWCR
jgi:FkbM family methyltransferase